MPDKDAITTQISNWLSGYDEETNLVIGA